jgi:hypothetical protein
MLSQASEPKFIDGIKLTNLNMTSSPKTDHAPSTRKWRSIHVWLVIVSGALFIVWLIGLISFVKTRGSFKQHINEFRGHSVDKRNLVAIVYGPTISASSFENDFRQQYHPLFTIDENSKPSAVEKWCSSSEDKHPWIEYRWFEPALLHRVSITHGSANDLTLSPNSSYVLRCLRSASRGEEPQLRITNNTADTANHDFPCVNAIGVRIEFEKVSQKSNVCIVEIEAWGQ